MTKDLEKLTLRELVNEIVTVERRYEAILKGIEQADSVVEVDMGNIKSRAKQYESRLKILYEEIDRREKTYSGKFME